MMLQSWGEMCTTRCYLKQISKVQSNSADDAQKLGGNVQREKDSGNFEMRECDAIQIDTPYTY